MATPQPPKPATARARLAATVRRERAKRGWTQVETAEAIGIHLRHVQMIEAGRVNITIDTLVMVAKAFGLDVRDLFAES